MTAPYSVTRLAVTGSTQDDAREAYAGEPILVVADAQTRGRGRGGSMWETAPRAVAASLAFDPGWAVTDWPLLPLVAGVAAARVLECSLKWPNDLVTVDITAGGVGERKMGGILVEAGSGPVVVGIGVNLWWPRPPAQVGAVYEDEPDEQAGEALARAWADQLLTVVNRGADAWPRSEYAERCVTLGKTVSWEPDGVGRASWVSEDGALIVESDAGTVHLRSGEVRHIRATLQQ